MHDLDSFLFGLAVAGDWVRARCGFIQGDGAEVGVRGVAAVDRQSLGLGAEGDQEESCHVGRSFHGWIFSLSLVSWKERTAKYLPGFIANLMTMYFVHSVNALSN